MKGFGISKNPKRGKTSGKLNIAKNLLTEAATAYQKKNFEQARDLLQVATQLDEHNAFTIGFLATVEKALGNTDKASKLFEESIKLEPNNADILHNYSAIFINDEPQKALDLSDRAIKISPNNSIFLERNGFLRWQIGDLETAAIVTLNAIKSNPGLIDARINLVGIYKEMGDPVKASRVILEFAEHNQISPSLLLDLLSVCCESDLKRTKEVTIAMITKNPNLINSPDFIESITWFGENFAKKIIQA